MKKSLLIISIILFSHFSSGCAKNPTVDKNKEKVVLVHGFGRSAYAMRSLERNLKDFGYQVHTLDYDSLDKNIAEIKLNVFSQINECCSQPDKKVHFVGHSFGGLLIRSYLSENHQKKLGRVVMMGSPNRGTEVVDALKDKWYFSLAGPSAIELGTHGSNFLKSLKAPNYELGVIAGVKESNNEDILPGDDDGLVTVESTKVAGMDDFIILPVRHSMMRSNQKVAKQTIHFLINGHFNK